MHLQPNLMCIVASVWSKGVMEHEARTSSFIMVKRWFQPPWNWRCATPLRHKKIGCKDEKKIAKKKEYKNKYLEHHILFTKSQFFTIRNPRAVLHRFLYEVYLMAWQRRFFTLTAIAQSWNSGEYIFLILCNYFLGTQTLTSIRWISSWRCLANPGNGFAFCIKCVNLYAEVENHCYSDHSRMTNKVRAYLPVPYFRSRLDENKVQANMFAYRAHYLPLHPQLYS